MKRVASCFLAIFILFAVSALPVGAKEYTVSELDGMTVEVPESLFVFTQDLDPLDPNLDKAGVVDIAGTLKDYRDNQIYLNALGAGGTPSITISKKASATTQEVYNLALLSEQEFETFLSEMRGDAEDNDDPNLLYYEVEKYKTEGQPFFKVSLSMQQVQPGQEGIMSEVCYATIINGYTISFDTYTNGEVAEQTEELLRQMVDSAKIPNVLEKPIQTEPNVGSVFILLSPVLILVVLVAAAFVFSMYRKKKEKRERTVMMEKLAVYHKEKQEKEAAARKTGIPVEEPETLFANVTVYSDEAIKKACIFECVRRRLASVIIFFLIGICGLLMAVFVNIGLFYRLLLGAACLFTIIWPLFQPKRLFKQQLKAYQKHRSRTALYYFREEDFRITELQSATVYPYFQLKEIFETEEYFYLYVNKEQSYYIKKDGFKYGTAEQFRAFLKEKLGKKYK